MTMTVGFNFKGGGQHRESALGNGNAFVIDDDTGIYALVHQDEDGEIVLIVGDEREDGDTIDRQRIVWEGSAKRQDNGAIRIRGLRMREYATIPASPPAPKLPTYTRAPFLELSDGWSLDDARAEAQKEADKTGQPWYLYPAPSGVGYDIDLTPRYDDRGPVEEVRPSAPKAADPLAAYRDLAPGSPLYDRASGRQVGKFEGLTTGPIGESVQLHSDVTNHTAWSSGLALTPHAPMTPGDCRP